MPVHVCLSVFMFTYLALRSEICRRIRSMALLVCSICHSVGGGGGGGSRIVPGHEGRFSNSFFFEEILVCLVSALCYLFLLFIRTQTSDKQPVHFWFDVVVPQFYVGNSTARRPHCCRSDCISLWFGCTVLCNTVFYARNHLNIRFEHSKTWSTVYNGNKIKRTLISLMLLYCPPAIPSSSNLFRTNENSLAVTINVAWKCAPLNGVWNRIGRRTEWHPSNFARAEQLDSTTKWNREVDSLSD